MELAQTSVEDATLKAPLMEVVDAVEEQEKDSGSGGGGGLPPADSRDPEEVASQAGSGSDGDSSEDNWESESLYEDALQVISDAQLQNGVPDACTFEEALAFRKRLHAIGKAAFVEETIGNETISAKKLCTAFGILPPGFLEGAPDEAYHTLLAIGISREYSRRPKLPEYNTVDDAVELLKKSKRIIVVTGAGISTSLGIPDFRSKDTGLYARLEYLGLTDAQEVFDIHLFRQDPSIFYSIAKDILPTEKKFSPTHAFLRLLQDKEKLLTNFTQNIDNVEANAGVLPENLIQCHGSFATATCMKCAHKVSGDEILEDTKKGVVPECARCKEELANQSQGMKRKRSSTGSQEKSRKNNDREESSGDEEDYDIPTPGVMKPDIIFFGEGLPDAFGRRLVEHDRDLADLVIVIGTSLKVAPVSEVPGFMPRHVPQIYISRTPVSHIGFDIDMIGDCDVVISELCRRAGWDLNHEMIPEREKVKVELVEGYESRYTFTPEVS